MSDDRANIGIVDQVTQASGIRTSHHFDADLVNNVNGSHVSSSPDSSNVPQRGRKPKPPADPSTYGPAYPPRNRLQSSSDFSAFKCEQCGMTYSRLEHLSRHERRHKEEKPFLCLVCNKSFGRRDVLNRHMTIHKGINPKDPAYTAYQPSSGPRHPLTHKESAKSKALAAAILHAQTENSDNLQQQSTPGDQFANITSTSTTGTANTNQVNDSALNMRLGDFSGYVNDLESSNWLQGQFDASMLSDSTRTAISDPSTTSRQRPSNRIQQTSDGRSQTMANHFLSQEFGNSITRRASETSDMAKVLVSIGNAGNHVVNPGIGRTGRVGAGNQGMHAATGDQIDPLLHRIELEMQEKTEEL